MSKIKILITILLISCSYAGEDSLQQWFSLVKKETKPATVEDVPATPYINNSYMVPVNNNLFDVNKLQNNQLNKNYTYNQLQMVGYMKYKGIDYAFIKTPYETISLKPGDLIKDGKVVKITPNSVLIDEYQNDKDKKYVVHIVLDLSTK